MLVVVANVLAVVFSLNLSRKTYVIASSFVE